MHPDPARWPSSKGGKGFTQVAEKVHVMGGISTQDYSANTLVIYSVKGGAYEESGRQWCCPSRSIENNPKQYQAILRSKRELACVAFALRVATVKPEDSSASSGNQKQPSPVGSQTQENKTPIVSPGEIFELGLFGGSNMHGDTVWYLGIWFKRFPRRIVWVANRDNPLSHSTAVLRIHGSNLQLLNHSDSHVWWKTNLTSTGEAPLVAELLDDGNFVLRYSNNRSNSDGVLWQSFDYPTDTLLPGMELFDEIHVANDRTLRAWRSADDPSSGVYTYEIDGEFGDGPIHHFIREYGTDIYRMDPTDTSNSTVYRRTETGYKASYSLPMKTTISYYATLRLSYTGALSLWEWTPAATGWKQLWKLPADRCDEYDICGDNNYCIMNPSQSCECFQGFQPLNSSGERYQYEHKGCVRKSNLTCVDDGFELLKNMKLPLLGDGTIVNPNLESDECKESCHKNCNCTAFAITDMPDSGLGCVMWTGVLADTRRYTYGSHEGQHLYVKLANRDREKNNNERRWIIGSILGGTVLLLVISVLFWQRKKIAAAYLVSQGRTTNDNPPSGEWTSELMDFEAISQATNGFSDENKIGRGGFGNVYKGRLIDGQEIAVKRMFNLSADGCFNEVSLIRKLQHNNLVRLLGYYSDVGEKILVYEYLENSSLDKYLFDTTRRSMLTWDLRLDITKGIARGLVYLHEDSRFRIVHLDIKASNVLLGKDMIPKISDFGMAKTLEGDDTEAVASTGGGTFAYMAPEYKTERIYSAKSDVYSFGVLLLEIVTGTKTTGFPSPNEGESFLSSLWTRWTQGKGLEIVDPLIKDSAPEQALRCIHIALLCVQGNARDRPTMSSVVFMLGSETELISIPKSPLETGSSSKDHPRGGTSTMSNNHITLSTIVAR